ncbi:Zinc-dependent metalloprotease, partial [Pseudomonas syringae pv. aceris]
MPASTAPKGVKLPASCCMRSAGNHQASYEAAIHENPANAAINPAYNSETDDTGQPRQQARLL